jgi:hypothetical protein
MRASSRSRSTAYHPSSVRRALAYLIALLERLRSSHRGNRWRSPLWPRPAQEPVVI